MTYPRLRLAMVSLLTLGCTASPTPLPPGSSAVAPTASPVTGAPTSTTAVTVPGSPTSTSAAPITAAMPAPDGREMLWPTTQVSGPRDNQHEFHGFVDVSGKLVVPARYENYTFCPDASGRAYLLLAFRAGKKAEVLDLAGRLRRRLPTAAAQCGPPGFVIASTVINGELGQINDSLLKVETGTAVIPSKTNRRITELDAHTVNVSDPAGEFFVDLDTGRRTPHLGWLVTWEIGEDTSLLPAVSRRPGPEDQPARIGLIDRNGQWVLSPRYDEIGGFHNGRASYRAADRTGFLNRDLTRSAQQWAELSAVDIVRAGSTKVLGYLVSANGQQGLLGADLAAVVPLSNVEISCEWGAAGRCLVTGSNRPAQVSSLLDGSRTELPAGFTKLLGAGFAADAVDDGGETVQTRLLVLATSRTIELPHPAHCSAVGEWLACVITDGVQQRLVFDREGNRTGFATARPAPDPGSSDHITYYWVTAGDSQGFVDVHGAWHYRESRFTDLED